MKENKKSNKRERRDEEAAIPKAKTLRDDSGKLVRQYPQKVGFHGTDRETDLNPEE